MGDVVYGGCWALDLHYLTESLNTLWGRQSYHLRIPELTEVQYHQVTPSHPAGWGTLLGVTFWELNGHSRRSDQQEDSTSA